MSSLLGATSGAGSRTSAATRWLSLAGLCGLLFALYFNSWQSMRQVWDTPTYTHGYVVPLIAVWLGWRQRQALAAIAPSTGWSALPVLALFGLLWLAGDLAGVNAAQHFAIVGMAVLLVPLVFGWSIARKLAFPLGFLFFAVPFGDFLLPLMMEVTATVTVALVRMSGVPIYREGMSFVLPSGAWEVIEECSGQRYLIAALPLACLFAWISFERNRTRWLFVLFAIAVALLANWLRAWGIVMLGHLSGMTIATGVDHLIYGWGFFGVVMGLLFWFGSHWKEAKPGRFLGEEAAARLRIAAREAGGRRGRTSAFSRTSAAALAGALVLAAWPGLSGYLVSRQAEPLDLEASTSRLAGFIIESNAGVPGTKPSFTPAYQGARQEVQLETRAEDGGLVSVWIGSFEKQRDDGEMIQHGNSIRSRAARQWTLVAERTPPAAADGGRTERVAEYVLAAKGRRILVWRTYFIDGVSAASETRAKLLTAWRVARGRGDRSIAAILWTPIDGEEQPARIRLAAALGQLTPVLTETEAQP